MKSVGEGITIIKTTFDNGSTIVRKEYHPLN